MSTKELKIFRANDVVLDDEDLEKRKGKSRRRIRSSRALLTSEVKVWQKAVLKYKAMSHLSAVQQAHLRSSGDLNREAILKHQGEVNDALADLVTISSLVEGEDDEFQRALEKWQDDLWMEKEQSQEFADNIIHEICELANPMLSEGKDRREVVDSGSGKGATAVAFQFRPMVHMAQGRCQKR